MSLTKRILHCVTVTLQCASADPCTVAHVFTTLPSGVKGVNVQRTTVRPFALRGKSGKEITLCVGSPGTGGWCLGVVWTSWPFISPVSPECLPSVLPCDLSIRVRTMLLKEMHGSVVDTRMWGAAGAPSLRVFGVAPKRAVTAHTRRFAMLPSAFGFFTCCIRIEMGTS